MFSFLSRPLIKRGKCIGKQTGSHKCCLPIKNGAKCTHVTNPHNVNTNVQ